MNMPAAKKTGRNPHFKSTYSTLQDVMEVVRGGLEHGLVAAQVINFEGEQIFIETTLKHVASEETLVSRTPVKCKDPSNPQSLGSGISYARRYALMSIFGIVGDDDDGHTAAKPPPRAANRGTPKPQGRTPEEEERYQFKVKCVRTAFRLLGTACEVASQSERQVLENCGFKGVDTPTDFIKKSSAQTLTESVIPQLAKTIEIATGEYPQDLIDKKTDE
jgi:hypothetical protein